MDQKKPISDRLRAETHRSEREGPDFARAYERLIRRLVEAGAGQTAPGKGDFFPDFLLPDENGRLRGFGELSAGKSLVVSLNRGHWCSYCRIELEGLQAIHTEIAARGASIVAVTPDRQGYAQKLKARSGLAFPVLSDVSNGFAMSLGLVVWVGDEIRALYSATSTDLSEYQNDQGWLIPIPATYIVAGDRRIKASFVDPDFRRRMEPACILEALA